MKIYLVGGAVRDKLLGIEVKDRDWVVVGASPQDMLDMSYRQVGKDFPVFINTETGEEFALARTERKSGKGYTGFECYAAPDVTLEDDLLRRDLTVNAIAESESGQIIDPFNGQDDLKNKILRHVSPAFAEDPVRILRLARFAARFSTMGFRIAEETKQIIKQMVRDGEVNHLVAERVWQETERSLAEESPQVFFEVLRECSALKILFPEIDNLYGVPNPPQWHPEIDSGVHTMMVLQQAALLSSDPKIRFAALVHDLGKAQTSKTLWPKHHGHEAESVPLLKALCKRFRVPNDFKELAIIVAEFHLLCHKSQELSAKTLLKLLQKTDAFRRPDRFKEFLLTCEADARGRTGFENDPYPQREFLMEVYAAAAAVDVKSINMENLSGNQIAEQLHKMRLSAIRKVIKEDS